MEYQLLEAMRHVNEQDQQQENECYCNECGSFFPERYLVKVELVIEKQDRKPESFNVCSKECAEVLKESLESEGEGKFKIV